MKTNYFLKLGLLISVIGFTHNTRSQTTQSDDALVLEVENRVEVLRFGVANWTKGETNQTLRVRDTLRTGRKSRATLRLSNQGVLRVRQLTTLEIQPPENTETDKSVLNLQNGAAYFFNRDEPVETQFRTPQASGAIRGTEFNIEVGENGRTVVTLLDGAVDLTNQLGQVSLGSGEQGIVEPGQAPTKTSVLNAINIIQWGLYYPGVLDPDELNLDAAVRAKLKDSLEAYKAGDLLQAVAHYPTNRVPVSAEESVLLAALSLAVGEVEDAESNLSKIEGNDSIAGKTSAALRQLIAAVKFQTWTLSQSPTTATEWMAESYYQQSRSNLEEALAAAQNATKQAPNFGFAWSHLAELEFSFGRTDKALAALEKSLQLSPRNAQALSLKGFLLAAQNKIDLALTYFEEAIAIDGGLGNAWLGRGLCKIRGGNAEAGRQDLQVAATLEPHRAVLRSYLGKAYSNEGDLRRAGKELELAKMYDPNDPTAFLYSALNKQQQYRINESVLDLEKSQELNDNRSVFRSRLLLDQDRAVRSANLAGIYRDAGMAELSVREAARAVDYDYANYSAHLFLANSYDELRDPRQITLRYESPWLTEFLLANLLSPVGAGTLSQSVSQQEYSKLFERDRFGFNSSTEYLSRGDWLQTASQFGTFGNSSYSLDVTYRSERGQRPNADVDALTWWSTFKQQITPKDTILFQTVYSDFEAGDAAQYYNQTDGSQTQRIKERQEPNVFAGYHHEWAPGVHTLLLTAKLDDTFLRTDPENPVRFLEKSFSGAVTGLSQRNLPISYRSELDGYSTELQQIWQQPKQSVIIGGRYQTGSTETTSSLTGRPDQVDVEADLQRVSFYGYHQWQILEPLRLTTGVSYDRLDYPRNIDIAPITSEETHKDRVSPKVGLLWSATKDTHVRGYYSRSLGGSFFDTSIRIEPGQIAGFNQTFRSLIPESVRGLVPGSVFELAGVAADHKFNTGTYVGVEGQVLTSAAERSFGLYDAVFLQPVAASFTSEQIDYRERSILLTVNQLISKEWSLGLTYKLTEADLTDTFPGVPAGISTTPANLVLDQDLRGVLNEVRLFGIYNLPCGFFSVLESLWFSQSNIGYAQDIPGDDFVHLNLYLGYRFPRRQAEIRLGLLNITDQDYQLNPLNLHAELPRERTFAARFRFNY
ncbi:MAG: FecR domain-containing protein [Verrucomicrobia bacterium]|nr:FecR domain-containing protein [Verrucomicrobiota bacterium]